MLLYKTNLLFASAFIPRIKIMFQSSILIILKYGLHLKLTRFKITLHKKVQMLSKYDIKYLDQSILRS